MRIANRLSTPPHEPSGLRAEQLTRRFSGRTILDATGIEVGPGVLAVLEGPNGAGKTTLLRIFATVVRPNDGEASVDGYDVVRDGARVRERIGAAFVNERSLYWRLTGRENLRLFARTRGLSSRDARSQVDSLLEELDLVRDLAPMGGRSLSRPAPAPDYRPRRFGSANVHADRRAAARLG